MVEELSDATAGEITAQYNRRRRGNPQYRTSPSHCSAFGKLIRQHP